MQPAALGSTRKTQFGPSEPRMHISKEGELCCSSRDKSFFVVRIRNDKSD